MQPFGGQTRETLPLQMFAKFNKEGIIYEIIYNFKRGGIS
jgi:hypothetical protein